jgi:hypothetical protein
MKTCIKCKEEKDLNQFRIYKKCRDGYRTDCKICEKNSRIEYRLNNKEKIKEYNKEYKLNNKERFKEYNKEYHKKYNKQYSKQYRLNNKERVKKYNKEYQKEYRKQRRIIEPLFKLRCNICSNIRMAIKRQGYTKNTKTFQLLGCTYEEFKEHIEKKFTKGMNWENQGKWHLDHIYPISLAKDEEEIIRLNHYTNFQPLWALDNLKKGNKIIYNTQLKLI